MSMKTIATLPASCCAPGAPPLAEDERAALAARFKALGDPARVAIVNRLAGAGEAGLVEARRNGTWAYYRLVPESVAALGRTLAA